ncbi:SDR family NAD(P)-dependent oxidoreductase [Rubinisphaera margarita]|uniref:SDR family NAD(P)-dependent oxidoreductase n=1 Tax=Rubinisphaera margarita TaxID=2909586 RepID=UPI001EE98CC1|nr:SDR family NAD(P)-dependent oxidoreductase [Rubinisphaera margarita]MCG6155764.1 SDR family NAD(P)-dependent oxidoreductase [Rubinisphaera margarita]
MNTRSWQENDYWPQLLGYAAAGAGAALAGRAAYRHFTRYDFEGKTVLITGGSRGLGLVLARQLADAGARIVISARHEDDLDRAGRELRERGAEVACVRWDVTDCEQVVQMVDEINSRFGAIDVLINNAGVIQAGPVESMTLEDYDDAMKTHFYGPLYVTEAILPQMRARGEGRIVNISSIGGRIAVPHLLPYTASKFALVGYSMGLRAELLQDGITVTTICPGLMRTGSVRNAYFKGQHRLEHTLFKISDSIPVLTIGAENAARKIVRACQYGDAFAVLGAPMWAAEKLYNLLPNLGADAMGLVNRMLPGANGTGQEKKRGAECETRWSESWLTTLTQRAARRNNEVAR